MAGRYDPADLPDPDEELEKRPEGASDAELTEAAEFACGILAAAGINYAIIGGFGMKMRGSDRPTQDVDIAIEAGTTVQKLMTAFSSSSRWKSPAYIRILSITDRVRVRLPNLPNAVFRILVRGESGREVQVDLKLATHAGAPATLQGVRETRTFRGKTFITLTPFAAFCSKLKVFASRSEDSDLQDLIFLVQNYGTEIRARMVDVDELDLSVFIQYLSGSRRQAVMQILGLS